MHSIFRFIVTMTALALATSALASDTVLTIENNSKVALAYNFLPQAHKDKLKTVTASTRVAQDQIQKGGEWVADEEYLGAVVRDLFIHSPFYSGTRLLYSNVQKGIRLSITNSDMFVLELAVLESFEPLDSANEKMILKFTAAAWAESLDKVGIFADPDFYGIDELDYLPASTLDKALGLKTASIDIVFKIFKQNIRGTEIRDMLKAALPPFIAAVRRDLPDLDFVPPEIEIERLREIMTQKEVLKQASKDMDRILSAYRADPIILVNRISEFVDEKLYFTPSNRDLRSQMIYALLASTNVEEVEGILKGFEGK